jgi:D-amino-acid dehydrogenase
VTDVIVLGAGIVGVSVAIHLQKRGRAVLLVDRREPGLETSFGNAGIIQAEGIRPHEFPRDLATIWRTGLNRSIDARYHMRSLYRFVAPLARYWWHSEPSRYDAMVRDYAPLIHNAVPEHAELIGPAGAEKLIRKDGWLLMYRSEAARDAMFAEADRHYAPYGVGYQKLDGGALAAMEPDLKIDSAGALRWTEPWTVTDPGALVGAYARLFQSLGGTIKTADALPLQQSGSGWSAGGETAAEIVVALGPWADAAIRPLGYRMPLFVKRGYHVHYAMQPGTKLNNWLYDAEGQYLLAPMDRGVRLTTGAEFARQEAPQTPAQLDGAERIARDVIPLAERVDPQPWMGARPCTPDMKPVIGPAPRHKGLWFAFGHAHHGLTLGPVTGRLLAERMTGETPFLNLAPFGAERFLR